MFWCNTYNLKIILFFAITSSATTQKLSDSLNTFAINLLTETSRQADPHLNVALSPYTVWSLLTVLSEGAKDGTADQLEGTLRIPSKIQVRKEFLNMSNALTRKSDDVNLELDTAIFTDKSVNLVKSFELLAKKYYKVNLNPINFKNTPAAVSQINKYVSRATNARIPMFVDQADVRDAQIFVTSVFYFKGNWNRPFPKNETKPEPFYDEKNMKTGDVDMMLQMGFFPYSRLPEINSFAVELPYGEDKKVSMIVILPFKGETTTSVLDSMAKMSFSFILNKLDEAARLYADEDVYVHLPKFKIKSDFNLNRVLYKMGIHEAFDVNRANFLGMVDKNLYLSRVIQRADIEVDEEGTVASAAAGASFPNKAPPPRLRANRPFLYFIVDKPTRSILFAGRVTNPSTLK